MNLLGRVNALPDAVKNLLALNSMQAKWAAIYSMRGQGTMGYRIYHNMHPMKFSANYVCLNADDARDLGVWIGAIERWKQLYGPRL